MPRSTRTGTPLTLMKPGVTYPIRAVSLMTGVSIDTLRAWERRYAAVVPERDERGRIYTDAHVRRIRLLREATAAGHAIGRVASLDDEQLQVLVTNAATSPAAVAPDPAPALRAAAAPISTEALVAALDRFDGVTVETELSRAATMLRAPELLRDVIVPVLVAIGDRWHAGQARIAHEHLLSASVRNVLGSLLRVHQKAGVPDRLLFATPSGERHEFGTLGAAVMAASGGLGTVYLGTDIPADDIVHVVTTVDLDVVVIGVTDVGDVARVEAEVATLVETLPTRVELWVGGAGAERMAARYPGRIQAITSYDVLEQHLVRLGARF